MPNGSILTCPSTGDSSISTQAAVVISVFIVAIALTLILTTLIYWRANRRPR